MSSLKTDYNQKIGSVFFLNQNTCCNNPNDTYDIVVGTDAPKKKSRRGKTTCSKKVIVQLTMLNDGKNNIMERIINSSAVQSSYELMKCSPGFSLRKFLIDHDIDVKIFSSHNIEAANRIGIIIPKTVSFSFVIKPGKYFSVWCKCMKELIFEVDVVQSTAATSVAPKKLEKTNRSTKSPCPVQTIIPWGESSKNFHNMFLDIDAPSAHYNEIEESWTIHMKQDARMVNWAEGCSHMFRVICFRVQGNERTEIFRKFSSPFKCTSKCLKDIKLNDKTVEMFHETMGHKNGSENCEKCKQFKNYEYFNRLRDLYHLASSNIQVETFYYKKNELCSCSLGQMTIKSSTIDKEDTVLSTLKDYVKIFFNISQYKPMKPEEYLNSGSLSIQHILSQKISNMNSETEHNQTLVIPASNDQIPKNKYVDKLIDEINSFELFDDSGLDLFGESINQQRVQNDQSGSESRQDHDIQPCILQENHSGVGENILEKEATVESYRELNNDELNNDEINNDELNNSEIQFPTDNRYYLRVDETQEQYQPFESLPSNPFYIETSTSSSNTFQTINNESTEIGDHTNFLFDRSLLLNIDDSGFGMNFNSKLDSEDQESYDILDSMCPSSDTHITSEQQQQDMMQTEYHDGQENMMEESTTERDDILDEFESIRHSSSQIVRECESEMSPHCLIIDTKNKFKSFDVTDNSDSPGTPSAQVQIKFDKITNDLSKNSICKAHRASNNRKTKITKKKKSKGSWSQFFDKILLQKN